MHDDGIELYRRFLDGDERGLAELITLYQHGLFRFIYSYVNDVGLAEDVLIDTFFTLYYKRPFKETDEASLKTFIYKIARNTALNALKKRLRRKEISLEALAEKGDGALDDAAQNLLYGSPEKALEQAEQNKALRMALLQLKKEYREVLYLRFFHNLSVEEIANITQKKVKQVYN